MTRLRLLAPILAVVAVIGTNSVSSTAATGQRVTGRAGTVWDHHTVDSWGDPTAVASGDQILDSTADANTQALMGWGAGDPEPSVGGYDWSSLDYRVAQLTKRNGTPVLTLCCSPWWMRGDTSSATDWSGLTKAPLAEHYADFAALAAAAAARYPQIKYFQVWNEMKGFWNSTLNRWNYEGYTELYNDVYDAVKAVRPDAQIGGPYVVINSYAAHNPAASTLSGTWGSVDKRDLDVMTYWLAHKHGADFVTIDMSTATRDAGVIADPQTMTGKVTSVVGWLRTQTSLPIWFAEFGAPAATTDPSATAGAELLGLSAADRAGVTLTNFWGPEQQPNAACDRCMFTSTLSAGGGAINRFGQLMQLWHSGFETQPYQQVVAVAAGVSALQAMSSATAKPVAWMLINTTSSPASISYLGKKRSVAAYGVLTSTG